MICCWRWSREAPTAGDVGSREGDRGGEGPGPLRGWDVGWRASGFGGGQLEGILGGLNFF